MDSESSAVPSSPRPPTWTIWGACLGGDMGFQGILKQTQGLFEHSFPKPLPYL